MPTERFQANIRRNLSHWQGRLDQPDERQLIELAAERHNLYLALQAGLLLPEPPAQTARLARAMVMLVERGGYWPECAPLLLQVATAIEPHDPCLAADLLTHLGHLQRSGDAIEAALELHLRANALASACAERGLQANIRYHLSEDYRLAGRLEEAEQAGLAALALFRESASTPAQLGAALNALGLIAWTRGDRETAVARLQDAAQHLRLASQTVDLVRCLNNLANALAANDQTEAALDCFEEARALLAGTPHLFDRVMLENSLGTLLFNLGRLAEAEAAFRRADSPALRQSPYARQRAITATNLGNLQLALGQLEEAEDRLRGALALWQPLRDPVMSANVLGTLAEVLHAQGRRPEALAALEEGLNLVAPHQENAFARQLKAQFTHYQQAWTAGMSERTNGGLSAGPREQTAG